MCAVKRMAGVKQQKRTDKIDHCSNKHVRIGNRWNVDSFFPSSSSASLSHYYFTFTWRFFSYAVFLKANLIYTMSASCQRIGTFIYYSISQTQMFPNSFHDITFCKFASIHSNSSKRTGTQYVMNADIHKVRVCVRAHISSLPSTFMSVSALHFWLFQ